MRLILPTFSAPVPVDSSYVTVVSICDIHLYASIKRALFSQINGTENEPQFLLFDSKDKLFNLSKSSELVLDPLLIDFKSKKITNALINKFKNALCFELDEQMEIEKNLNEVQEKVINLFKAIDITVKTDSQWDGGRLIKALGIELDVGDNEHGQRELLSIYLDMAENLEFADFHFFFGLNQSLDNQELNSFYKEILQKQVSAICFERNEVCPNPSKYVRYTHVDEDYEEIVILPSSEDSLTQ